MARRAADSMEGRARVLSYFGPIAPATDESMKFASPLSCGSLKVRN